MKKKVLIIDDSEIMLEVLKRILSAEPEIEVIGAAKIGSDGITMFKESKPDIVFLEADIGDMDVMDIITEMHRIDSSARVILCSDPTTRDKIVPASQAGTFDFINKPYIKSRVLRTIRGAKNN